MPVPGGRAVKQALRELEKALKATLAAVNGKAAERMAKGDYEIAEALASKGKEIGEFLADVAALKGAWRDISATGASRDKNERTPLWHYYRPILEALVEAGGKAARAELEPNVESRMSNSFRPADRVRLTSGLERWQVLIRRDRKELLIQGWIKDSRGHVWEITEAGRRAASGEGPPETGPSRLNE